MTVKISVVIITLNEERLIGKCLESIKEIADEIVVVDSFSTDRTEEICLSHGARFIKHHFLGHIEQANYALDQATHDHVLVLDADESLDEQAQKEVATIKSSFECDGYRFNRLNNFCGTWIRHGAWYPDRKIRLWDRTKGRWGGDNPHNLVNLEPGSVVKQVKGDILHFTTPSVSSYLRQVNYFSDIAAENFVRDGKNFRLTHLLIRPPFRFFRDYFLKQGFRDGLAGFTIALTNAFGVFSKYIKLYYLSKDKDPDPSL